MCVCVCEVDHWALMDLLFIDICIFQAISELRYTAGPDWSKKLFQPININFAFEALWKLAIFRYGRFEFKAVSDKWLHESGKEEEEC